MRPRARTAEADGLAERRRLKLAGITDEAVLEAARPMRHPLYRVHDRLTPAEHAAEVRSRPGWRAHRDAALAAEAARARQG